MLAESARIFYFCRRHDWITLYNGENVRTPAENNSRQPAATATGTAASTDPDAELVARCRRGERAAQYALFRKYKDGIYAIAARMANDSQLAEDLAQKVFIRMFQQMDTFRGDALFSTWLYRIATNTCINAFRKASRWRLRLRGVFDEAQTGAVAAPAGGNSTVLRPHLEAAIRRLPPGYRMVFIPHDVEGYNHQEISRMLGIAAGTSKSQLHKARRELRAHLEPVLRLHREL